MRIRKIVGKTMVLCILCLSLFTCAYASELGEITTLKDQVSPDGVEDAVIVTEVVGVTDAAGNLAFSKYPNAEITQVEVIRGEITGDWAEESTGMLTYYVIPFTEAEAEVEMRITHKQTGTYALSAGSISATGVSGLKKVTYSMTNSAPVKIAEYTLDLAVPQGWELVEIIGYSAKSGYEIFNKDGYTFGEKSVGAVSPGGKSSLSITTREPFSTFRIILIAIVVAVSAFYLYVNRELLKISKEVRANQKAERAQEKEKRLAEKSSRK